MALAHFRVALLALSLFGGAACKSQEPNVAPDLELDRFQGHWYEIARIPRDYDRTCRDTTTDYRLLGPGRLELHHHCRLPSGAASDFVAPALAEDPSAPAKLTLDLGLYRGAYWVLATGPDYEYALIGHPSLTMLWVLARTPTLAPELLGRLKQTAAHEGFDPNALELTPQTAE